LPQTSAPLHSGQIYSGENRILAVVDFSADNKGLPV
jgi:hypothetical protein